MMEAKIVTFLIPSKLVH